MQQALEALEDERYVTKYTHIVDAIIALRKALEQPTQRKPLTFAGLSITEINLPDGMTLRFENNTLIIEAAHGIKEGT